jgi:hypothetical protein
MATPIYSWRGTYGCNTSYYLNDIVKHEGEYYVGAWDAESGIPWNIFPTDELFWSKASEEIIAAVVPPEPSPESIPYVWRGSYACETTYYFKNVVEHQGVLYQATWRDENGIPWNQFPDNTTYWAEASYDEVAPVLRKEDAAPAEEAPAPPAKSLEGWADASSVEAPVEEALAPAEEAPAPVEAPPAKSMDGWIEQPAPAEEAPVAVPAEEVPAPAEEAPPAKSMDGWVDAPAPTEEAPAPVEEVPAPAEEAPAPAEEQPAKTPKLYSVTVTRPDGTSEKISAISVWVVDVDNTVQIQLY